MIGRRLPVAILVAGSAALARILFAQESAPAAPTPTVAAEPAAPTPAFRWTDPDGKPLPFQSEAQLLEFLRTAEVKSEKHVSGGITFPTRVLLEKDGVRAEAIFRDVDESRNAASFGTGRGELNFRDSYIYEPAAYQLSLMLGLDSVPPATLRRLGPKNGSIQIWVEHAMTEKKMYEEKIQPPDEQQWNKQLQMINTFDALIYNTDRNRGNIIITPDWKLWMIDHTRTFRRFASLQNPAGLTQCERGMYQKLKTLDEATVRARLKEYLTVFELDALLKRRLAILERLDALIAEKGEDKVLYSYTFEPAPATAAAPAADPK